jgi:hypothetical protein
MGYDAGFGYALQAIVQGSIIRYGPSKGFGLALWAVVLHLVMSYGP